MFIHHGLHHAAHSAHASHPAHATHAGHAAGAFLLRDFSDDSFGRREQRGDTGGVRQRRPDNLFEKQII